MTKRTRNENLPKKVEVINFTEDAPDFEKSILEMDRRVVRTTEACKSLNEKMKLLGDEITELGVDSLEELMCLAVAKTAYTQVKAIDKLLK